MAHKAHYFSPPLGRASVQGMKLSFVPLLASEPSGEMAPGRAVADDGLNGLKQKQEDRERRRKRMNAPYAEVIPGTRRQEKQC